MSSLHLHPVEAAPPQPGHTLGTVFFVIQQSEGTWSQAGKIVDVCLFEDAAEEIARRLKKMHPQQCFGVAMLRSEARAVVNPIEIVRTEGNA